MGNSASRTTQTDANSRLMEKLTIQRNSSLAATEQGPPRRTDNPFFGVGPITDMTSDEVDARLLQFEFDAWLESRYPKLDDRGNPIGCLTRSELARGMHRGYPADKVLVDMMREIHRYFKFAKKNQMAVGLGGGHSGFTVCALHFLNANDAKQKVFVDTAKPETEAAGNGGFFRQSWGAQLIEMQRYARNGDESRIVFSQSEGAIPSAGELLRQEIKLFVGVGHETTGATTYSEGEVRNLLDWIDQNPDEHHAIIDGTSMLGAMPWSTDIVDAVMEKCCMFMPFQKAIGGISGYFVVSLTPSSIDLINANQRDRSWPVPRQLKLAVPRDPAKPLSSEATTSLGPIYDPTSNKMLGGIINTFSTVAFAETTFGLLRSEKRVGSVQSVNERSALNRRAVKEWAEKNPLFELAVGDTEKQGAAVTLLKVVDADVAESDLRPLIINRSKQLLGFEGITHANGDYEKGLDVARYVNAFPGTPGDYRAWIGGVRSDGDIVALLDNLQYAYHRAKIVVLEDRLAELGEEFPNMPDVSTRRRADDTTRAYAVLIADLIGLKFDEYGVPDHSAVQAHIEARGGVFHIGSIGDPDTLEVRKIHFFYQPNLSTGAELQLEAAAGHYDALIAAATIIPPGCQFGCGGVRIGAGTGNMRSESWGAGGGIGGSAPLMNTPSFNSRATAQMAMKALLKVAPNLPVAALHKRVAAGDFDTGRDLIQYPTEKLEGKRIAVLGFGNIGREVAKLASAFGMDVVVSARDKHRKWIEAEGYQYAANAVDAATGAYVLSPHIGLGAMDAKTGRFQNAGLINQEVMSVLADGAIVINYDRGELIDIDALDAALTNGKVSFAAIDADIFKDADTGAISGPMAPYQRIAAQHQDKLEMLPHAAADTDHLSRVEGAIQAVDQIFDSIQYRLVTNLVGDLPEGYADSGTKTVPGVGGVSVDDLVNIAENSEELVALRSDAEFMASFWAAVSVNNDPDEQDRLIENYGERLVLVANRYDTRLEDLGLKGPFRN